MSVVIFMRHFEKAPHPFPGDPRRLPFYARNPDELKRLSETWRLMDQRIGLDPVSIKLTGNMGGGLSAWLSACGIRVSKIYASPYRRTRESADLLRHALKVGELPIVDERLAEIDQGGLAPFAYEDFCRAFPEYGARSREDFLGTAPPFGESHWHMLTERILPLCQELAAGKEACLLLTHVSVLDCVDWVVRDRPATEVVERLSRPDRFPYGARLVCVREQGILLPTNAGSS